MPEALKNLKKNNIGKSVLKAASLEIPPVSVDYGTVGIHEGGKTGSYGAGIATG